MDRSQARPFSRPAWRLLALALCGSLASCGDPPARDNPLDPGGSAWGAADPALAVSYRDGAMVLSWRPVQEVTVLRYRIVRHDAAVDADTWTLLGEVAQPSDPASGDTLELVDGTRLVGAPDLAWRISIVTPFGESAALDEVAFATQDDLDGDGVVAGDCDAGNAAISPTAPEECNGADDDCDGATDEDACGPGPRADGEPCTRQGDCKNGYCGAGGLCGHWHEPCSETGECAGDLACADAFGVCTVACGAASCPGDMACIGGWCLPGCGGDAACATSEHCLVPTVQPIGGGGCAEAPTCDACAAGELCVADADAGLTCCADHDGDGRFALDCAWGTDCDDSDPEVAEGCGTCATSADCAGTQCVLLASGEGLCGGPAGCHCPAGSSCAGAEDPPRCVQDLHCLDASDCEIGALGRWQCAVVPSLGPDLRCVCDDPTVCPECLIDAECPADGVCESGRCVLP